MIKTVENIRVLNDLFSDAILVCPDLVEEIRTYVNSVKRDEEDAGWPAALMTKMTSPKVPSRLFIEECFFTTADWLSDRTLPITSDVYGHDCDLLGIPIDRIRAANLAIVKKKFIESRMCRWFMELFRQKGDQVYFGELSVALHSCLLDDPAPRRVEVKGLVQNWFSWINLMRPDGIEVDRPKYSQRIVRVQR